MPGAVHKHWGFGGGVGNEELHGQVLTVPAQQHDIAGLPGWSHSTETTLGRQDNKGKKAHACLMGTWRAKCKKT